MTFFLVVIKITIMCDENRNYLMLNLDNQSLDTKEKIVAIIENWCFEHDFHHVLVKERNN